LLRLDPKNTELLNQKQTVLNQSIEQTEEKLKVQYREGHSAEVVWEQTKKQLLAGKELRIDPDEIWKAFEAQATSRANPQRQKVYFSRLVDFCNWIKQNHPGAARISDVSTTQAKEWVAYIRSLEGSNSTKNDKLIALKMIFAALGKEYGIIEDPFAAIKKLPTKTISRAAFTPEELKLIGQNATGWMYSLCITAISTGLREGDVCLLKKSSVNLYTGWISISHTRKTGLSEPLEYSKLFSNLYSCSEISR
jgi:integrase